MAMFYLLVQHGDENHFPAHIFSKSSILVPLLPNIVPMLIILLLPLAYRRSANDISEIRLQSALELIRLCRKL